MTFQAQLRESKNILRQEVALLPDQKIVDIVAFNGDARMDFMDCCCCFVGVISSETPHEYCAGRHYNEFFDADIYRAERAEDAYLLLGYPDERALLGAEDAADYDPVTLRQRRLQSILKAELRRRKLTIPETVEVLQEVRA